MPQRNSNRLILKSIWGYSAFREGQEEIIDTLTQGRDVLAILPTGGGKSICYQVPGLALGGLTIVVSPLIALMQDQVSNLQSKGIRAESLISGMSFRQLDRILDNACFGGLDFLYVSPERIQTTLFKERYKRMPVSLIAIDEAHCISEWGHDFRPSYRLLCTLRKVHPKAPIIALTATATNRVALDIVEQLHLNNTFQYKGSVDRTNLYLQVQFAENKLDRISNYCIDRPNQCGIIYCQTRKSVKQVFRALTNEQVSTGLYHGGMEPEERSKSLRAWLTGQHRVMVATNAFGMGIDKPDVRFVLHAEVPSQLEAYVQEAGRAGRDGEKADAIAFWNYTDTALMKKRVEEQFPEKKIVMEIFHALCEYLRVAFSSGQYETYSLDFSDFCRKKKFPQAEAYSALKLLEMNGNLAFQEGFFRATQVCFNADQSSLYKFQVGHPSLSELIQFVLRSYPGIMEHAQRIDEYEIAKRLGTTANEIKMQLEQFQRYDLATIEWGSTHPQVTFLLPRPPSKELTLKPEIYKERKQLAMNRLNKMMDFLVTDCCRMHVIQDYFNQTKKNCDLCDRCLSKRTELVFYESEIGKLLETPKTFNELLTQLTIDAEILQSILREWLLEEKIATENGRFRIRK